MTCLLAMLAALSIGLGDFNATGRAMLEMRIRNALQRGEHTFVLEGTVTGVGESFFFIQSGRDAAKVACDGGRFPRPGDVVSVTGTAMLEGGSVLVEAKKWRKKSVGKLPDPLVVNSADLSNAGEAGGGTSAINWMRVVLEGRAIERTSSGFAMDVGGFPVTVLAAGLPSFLEGCGKTRPQVRVVGVVEQVFDQSILFGRTPWVMGVKLQINSERDIELLPDLTYLVNVRDRRVMTTIIATIALLGLGLVVFAVVIHRQRRRQFKTHTLMAERKRMADDIHDTIEQHLVGAGMLIQLNRNKEAREVLLRAKSELRDIVWGLKNDDMMRLTPTEMLKQTAEKATRKGIFRVTTRLAGLPNVMEAGEMRDLSLIVREAIGNAVKHGGAKKIAITADAVDGGGWLVRIANDGKPFDPENSPGTAEGHFGLEGMRERGRRIGARVSFGERNGWTVVSVEKNGGKHKEAK